MVERFLAVRVDSTARRVLSGAVVVGVCIALAACSGLGGGRKESNPKVYGLYDGIPEGGGVYKIGNPYQIKGQWFHPHEDRSYDRVGVASWYGEYFHGRKTANGEFYDMNRLTAAHPTLPMPVYARVTNLENGRTLVVRINDRGPFAKNRVIDLSRRAARDLGFERQGTAQVRVTYITDAPLSGDVANMQALDQHGSRLFYTASTNGSGTATPKADAALPAPVTTSSVPTAAPRERPRRPVYRRQQRDAALQATGTQTAGASQQRQVQPGYYVQAAAFRSQDRALSLAEELSHLGVTDILPADIGGEPLYRVRIGPLATAEQAERMLGRLADSGHGPGQIYQR